MVAAAAAVAVALLRGAAVVGCGAAAAVVVVCNQCRGTPDGSVVAVALQPGLGLPVDGVVSHLVAAGILLERNKDDNLLVGPYQGMLFHG